MSRRRSGETRRRVTAALAAGVASLCVAPDGSAQQIPSNVTIYPMGNFAQNAMVSSLAGVVNRKTNGELLLSPDNGSQPNPRFWLDQLKSQYPSVTSSVQSNTSLLLNQFRDKVNGYVLYDRSSNPDSINIATSIAGVTDSIIVDTGTLPTALLAGLPMTADARSMTYASAYATYGSQFNKDVIVHQDVAFDNQLRDFAVMNKAFTYWTNPTALNPAGQPAYASNQNHAGRIFGWANSEQDVFTQASQSNQQVVAANYSWSTSTTARWQVPISAQKSHPAGSITTQPGKHYVAFVMSDGDNAQWLTNGFATDPKWYGSPYRGNFNMTWDFTPSLMDMNPVAHNYLYGHASSGAHTDTFVDAGGAGTVFPSQYPDINGLAQSINDSMVKADLRVTSILDPTYDTSKLFPILDEPQVTGMMYKAYDNFYRRHGSTPTFTWHNGKPIMAVRYSLWDGADTAPSIAAALNNSTHADPIDDSFSYDIVNVHPWSTRGPDGSAGSTGDPMSNLNALVSMLDPNKVQVVGLEELMVHLRNHFGTPLPGADVNATWTRDASSNWGTTRTNWTGALPNFFNAKVTFGSAITAARTVTVTTPVTAGRITFDNATNGYTLAGTSRITLDGASGYASVNVTTGSHAINAPLTLDDTTLVTVGRSQDVLALGALDPFSGFLIKDGDGTVRVNQLAGGGVLDVKRGTVKVDESSPTLPALPSGNDAFVSRLRAVHAAGSTDLTSGHDGTLDLGNNDLIVDYNGPSPLADITAMVRHAFHGGDWLGAGITSSTAANPLANGNYALGVEENALLVNPFGDGTAGHPQFDGQSIDGTTVLVKFTHRVDLDLNGLVDANDAAIFNGGFTQGATGATWQTGDVDYDGTWSSNDAAIFNSFYNESLGHLPEPSGLLVLSSASVFALRPRSARRKNS